MNSQGMSSIFLIILMIVFMYFFMIRPQQRQRKEHQSMMSKLRPGDHVVTISRLHGVVSEINEQEHTVTLDCEGIYLTFDLVAVQRVESQAKKADQTDSDTADKKDDSSKEATSKAASDTTDTPADDDNQSADAGDSSDDNAETKDSAK